MDENHITRALAEIAKDRNQAARVLMRITQAVEGSFAGDRILRAVWTEAEVKRRTNICLDWFVQLRRDLGYSTEKALDYMPKALRSTLDGEPWEPPAADRTWAPPKVQA